MKWLKDIYDEVGGKQKNTRKRGPGRVHDEGERFRLDKRGSESKSFRSHKARYKVD